MKEFSLFSAHFNWLLKKEAMPQNAVFQA